MNYTYRFLEAADLPQFVSLYNRKETFMNEKMSLDEKIKYIERLTWLFSQPDYKSVGCFEEDKLVAVCNGRFFRETGTWYGHGQCFDLNLKSISQYREFRSVTARLIRVLSDYAESIGIYQFYSARELSEGLSFYKLQARTIQKGEEPIEVRYIVLPEKIYRKGDTEILEQHRFFFKPDNQVKKDVFVTLFVLKPELREELLRINQQP